MSLRARRLPWYPDRLGALHGLPARCALHHHRRGQFIVFLVAGMAALQLPDFGRQLTHDRRVAIHRHA
jgi:hypothetical protein